MARRGWATGRGSTVTTGQLEFQVRFYHTAMVMIISQDILVAQYITTELQPSWLQKYDALFLPFEI